LRRFDRYWEVLFSHLMNYRFAYPADRDKVPEWVLLELMSRTLRNLLSRVNYGIDIEHWGYRDGRAWDEATRGERGEGSEREVASGGRR
jgi:hypothetical protein